MTAQPRGVSSFVYRARTADGQQISGAIDATDGQEANRRLASLRLEVIELAAAPRPSRTRPLGGEDFLAFNQQLAQITSAGLPVEQGLALIAQEMRSGSMRRTIERISADLDRGQSLAEAVESNRAQFPPLYARLIDAGIRAGNLSGVLLNLGRHLTLHRRLQSTLRQTLAYPLIVVLVFIALLDFIMTRVVPNFADLYRHWYGNIPAATRLLLQSSQTISQFPMSVLLIAILLAIALLIAFFTLTSRGRITGENLWLRMPVIGPVLRNGLISRWCDAVGLGIEAGLDLPASISLADEAINSPRIKADSQTMLTSLAAGQPLAAAHAGQILPPTIPAAIDLAAGRNNLPATLRTLGQMYQQQAEIRLASIPAVATPLIMVLLGVIVGILMILLFLPIIQLIQVVG